MGGANTQTITFPLAFTDIETFDVFLAPGTGDGGQVNGNISFKKLSPTQVAIVTGDGATSALVIDAVAIGY